MKVVKLEPVVKNVLVRRGTSEAFRLFTEKIHAWWPLKTHSLAKDALGEETLHVTIEPRAGGRIFETLNTGEERDWGEVLVFEPGSRLVFSFQMGRPKEKSGEVEVRFDPLDATSCRVTLTHSHWERLGDEAEVMRGRFNKGWEDVFVAGFGGFAAAINS